MIGRLFRITSSNQENNSEVQVGLRALLCDAVCSQLMDSLTGGALLVSFALLLGASNTVVGLLAAISPLMQLFQVPAVYLVERASSRKSLVVRNSVLSRISWLIIAVIPWVVAPEQRVHVLLICLFLFFGLGTLSACGYNPWIRDFVPQDIMGRFFGKSLAIATAAGALMSLAAGAGIEIGKSHLSSQFVPYSILFLFGGIVGLSGVYFLSRVPEPRVRTRRRQGTFEALGQPFRDPNFRRLLIFLGILFFAMNLSGPFYVVYMLKRLDLSMSLVIGLGIVGQIMSVICFRIWGKAADNFSNKSVLIVSGYMYFIAVLLWPFLLFSESYFVIPSLVLIHMLSGISAAGVNLCTANIALVLAPHGKATGFLAANTLVHGIAAATAPILGGIVADILTGEHSSLITDWISTNLSYSFDIPISNLLGIQSLFLVTGIIGLYSIHRLRAVHEEHEVEGRVVVAHLFAEVKKGVRQISRGPGLEHRNGLPFVTAEENGPERSRVHIGKQ